MIKFLDTTLRDGAQGEGISFSVSDKINIVKALDDFGISYIEAGNPFSNPKDLEFFEEAAKLKLKNAVLCAFGSTIRKNTLAAEDKNIQSLLHAGTKTVTIFGKAWAIQAEQILGITPTENLSIIYDTISYLESFDKEVIFDAEHFFDGYKDNPLYAIDVLKTAKSAGASTLVLCDTRGGTLPSDIADIVKAVCVDFPDTEIGVHLHDDIGCAVAASLMSVSSGAAHIQGSFIGVGERCGNADLSVIIPNLQLKQNIECGCDIQSLTNTAKRICEISNLRVRSNKPYIGKSAFAHKGGMHIDGMEKQKHSFEHINPSEVGNKTRYLVSEMSGRNTVLLKAQLFNPSLNKSSPEIQLILDRLKALEHDGYQFEAADASLELLIKRILFNYKPSFEVVLYKTTDDYPAPGDAAGVMQQSSALVQIKVDGVSEIAASLGNGPVNALDKALRRALFKFYPHLSNVTLSDYKVRVLDQNSTTAAKIRVLIETTDGKATWTTVGVSTDIIEASFIALTDSLEYITSTFKK